MADIVQLEKSAFMKRYYTQRALSSISATPFFKFTKVAWGSGFVSFENNRPVVDDIPTDVVKITGEFARTVPALSLVNDEIIIRATINTGDLPAGTNEEFSALYLLDDEEQVVAIFAVAPVWMNDRRGLTVEGVIEIGQP